MTIGNGSIPLRIGNLIDTDVFGGPYMDRPTRMFGVKMAQEIDEIFNVDVPTRDFDVPAVSDLRQGIVRALMAMINDRTVYVGCMGGIGRTGIFLAALAKVQSEFRVSKHRAGGAEDPVMYVRKHFIPHAVETTEQMAYIARFDVSDIVRWLDATQIAMGLNIGYQKKETDDPCLAVLHRGTPTGRIVGDPPLQNLKPVFKVPGKVDLDALDNFKADWKERYRRTTLVAEGEAEGLETRTLDWMDSPEADSKDEGTADNAQWLQAESLQNQLDELDARVELAEGSLVSVTTTVLDLRDASEATRKALASLGKACKVGFEEALTNQTYFGKIRDLFK